jgi:UDP-N-acetylmuramoyl-tripeptide--D-alanyl-D-alanine ligase
MFTLGFVLETLTGQRSTGDETTISSVVIDSRLAMPGSLFIAFAGEHVDGHNFVSDAFERGALAALIDQPINGAYRTLDARLKAPPFADRLTFPLCILVNNTLDAIQLLGKRWRERFQNLRVIGITGSVGKTTTKELTYAVLSQHYRTLKSEGNYNNEIGLPLTLLSLRPGHQRAILEMGMYNAGEIRSLCDLATPDIGVVTIVGSVHMEWLGSIEAIAQAKQELVEALPSGPQGVAILNKDDPLVMAMADHSKADIFTYGLDNTADLWADNINSMGLNGMHFTLHYASDQLRVQVPLLGRHSVHTALRAAAVGLVEGLTWDEIIRGLRALGAQLRLVAVPGPKNSVILDDTYNSSPESAVAALNLLSDLDGRRLAVLGDMLELGPVEETSHRIVGRRVRDVAHILVTVGPLGELIAEEALAVGMPEDKVFIIPTAEEAVAILKEIIEPSDVILVKASRSVGLDYIVSVLGQG